MPQADDQNTGDDKGSGGTGNEEVTKQIGALASTVKLLSEGFAEVKGALSKLSEKSDSSDDKTGGAGDNNDNGGDDDSALETMSRKEFAAVMLSRASKEFEKKLEGIVSGQLKKVDERLSGTEAREQLRELLPNNPDLNEWKDEMVALLKEGRVRSFEDALTLARASNPEKVKKIEAARKEKEDKEGGRRPRGFGGLTPTSSASGGEGSKKMTVKEAGNAAWEATMAEFGDVLKTAD